jgi:hypothetical protein
MGTSVVLITNTRKRRNLMTNPLYKARLLCYVPNNPNKFQLRMELPFVPQEGLRIMLPGALFEVRNVQWDPEAKEFLLTETAKFRAGTAAQLAREGWVEEV